MDKKSSSGLVSFLKKRAPFYLAGIAILVVFVVPELTKTNLAGSFPELDADRQQAVDILMGYNGPDGDGLTVMDAVSAKIEDEYPNERIYDHRSTSVELDVTGEDPGTYRIVLDFVSYKGGLHYDWSVDAASGEITPNDPASRHIIDVVDFYD
ncbi:MAG: hypothetical protein EB829_05615 [Nitrosopumilus sp. H8]|nr:MAG: hypothetical protein EB829_05615 [Nitrosopumilus sp. H8]